MKKIWTLAVREYNAAVRTKAFLISLLLLPVMMGGGIGVSEFSQRYAADVSTKRVAIIDRTSGEQLFEPLRDAAEKRNETTVYEPTSHRQMQPKFELIRVPPSAGDEEAIAKQRFDLAEQTRRGEIFAFLEIQPGVLGGPTTAKSGPLAPVLGGETSVSSVEPGQGEGPSAASATDARRPSPPPSPWVQGEGGSNSLGTDRASKSEPLTPALSPEYRGEGDRSTTAPSNRVASVTVNSNLSTSVLSSDAMSDASVFYSSNTPTFTAIQQWANTAIGRVVTQRKIETLGIPRDTARSLLTQVPIVPQSLARKDASGKIVQEAPPNLGVTLIRPVATIMLMFVIVLVGSSPMSMNIMEEKQQKIAEVMLGSVRPFELMMGKLLGGVGVALTLIAIYFGAAGYAAAKLGYTQYVSFDLIAWFVVFSIVAVFLYGSMFLAVGAAVNNAREAQSLITPVMMLVVLPILMLTPMLQAPSGTLAMIFSFFPLSAPMIAMARLTIPPGIPTWQPVVSLILAILAAIVVIWAAGRIFRVGLLLQGKAPRLKDLAQWVIRG